MSKWDLFQESQCGTIRSSIVVYRINGWKIFHAFISVDAEKF